VARVIADLEAHARPLKGFDPDRYFRTTVPTTFLNTGTPFMRGLGTAIAREHRTEWSLADALAVADGLVRDSRFDAKIVGIEVLACFHRQFTPAILPIVKRWLAQDHCANWASTDSLCGYVIGPLLLAHQELIASVMTWTSHRNLWVRRASAVALIKPAVRTGGVALAAAFHVATALRADRHDLIHKAVGWLLRETGRVDADRLVRYLRDGGPTIPRTTIRYAIERFAPALRHDLLASTRAGEAHA
jgi:3-methyladenine DNA glycosylase AlkD